MLFSHFFSNFLIFARLFRVLIGLWSIILWCDLISIWSCSHGRRFSFLPWYRCWHPACLHCILSLVFTRKEKVIFIDYKQTFGDLLASSPTFSELDVWLANASEQYWIQQPLAIRSSDLSKAVSWHDSTRRGVHCPAISPLHKRGFLCSECTSTVWLG